MKKEFNSKFELRLDFKRETEYISLGSVNGFAFTKSVNKKSLISINLVIFFMISKE